MQDIRRRSRIVEGAVRRRDGGMKMCCESSELAVANFVAHQRDAGEPCSVDDDRIGPRHINDSAGAAQKPDVVGSVMCNEHSIARKVQEQRQHGGQAGGVGDERIGDARQRCDEGWDGLPGIDQGLEFSETLAAANFDGADLGDACIHGGSARGLQVDDDEGDVRERRAQVVEGGGIRMRRHRGWRWCGRDRHAPTLSQRADMADVE